MVEPGIIEAPFQPGKPSFEYGGPKLEIESISLTGLVTIKSNGPMRVPSNFTDIPPEDLNVDFIRSEDGPL